MIAFDCVSKRYGGRTVVDDLSLTLPAGALSVLIGPSGCGKSTTLRMINRLVVPEAGRVSLQGRDVGAVPAGELRRGIGYAIQAVGLFPHWTIARNIATVPALLGWDRARIAARVDALLRLLDLDPDLYAGRMPAALSGGQQQRVGIARALAADPPVLLMDEPFGALDPLTRAGIQRSLRAIQAETRKTIVFVTHDMDEALLLADHLVLLDRGRLVQAGPPATFFASPASAWVQSFVGGEQPGLRRLSLQRVSERYVAGEAPPGPALPLDASLREALETMLRERLQTIAVTDGGRPVGALALASLL